MPPLDPKIQELIDRLLASTAGVPITIAAPGFTRVDFGKKLQAQPPLPAFFPQCADVLVSLCKPSAPAPLDDIDTLFTEYFAFGRPDVQYRSREALDPSLASCVGTEWPPECCLPDPCVKLDGKRDNGEHIRRLFAGDSLFLFFFDRMGMFRILGAILDDYATKGMFPISTGTLPGPGDEQVYMVLEAATLETKTGRSSTVRDRESAYRRALGWTLRQAQVESQVNQAVSEQLARLAFLAGQFYTDRRLAVAVRGAAAPAASASVATLISIKDTIILLQNALTRFYYGRTYTITLTSLVWLFTAMTLVRALRTTLGIPETLTRPEDYISAAYDKFLGGAPTPSQTNRYIVHRDCARAGRDLLLDIEMLDTTAPDFANTGQQLDLWLATVESKFETYRNGYRLLTGVDLAITERPVIEQQA